MALGWIVLNQVKLLLLQIIVILNLKIIIKRHDVKVLLIIKLTHNQSTYGLSNHLLNTPWQKVTSIKSQFNTYIESNSQIYANDLFCILIDNTKAQENALPNTGVSKEFEKQLSPIFIQTENYGT